MSQRIAILGWGSLITRPRNLKSSSFDFNGPIFPIQFSRISRYGSVTLVKDLINGLDVVTWSAISDFNNLGQAINNLKEREETIEDYIGFIDLIEMKYSSVYTHDHNIFIYKGYFNHDIFDQELPTSLEQFLRDIINWSIENNVESTIWTDLPTNFSNNTNFEFNYDNLMYYLSSLPSETKYRNIDYILNIPSNVYHTLNTDLLLSSLSLV